MHPFLEGTPFAAFAHRGGALEAAENTLEAFEYAISLGYRYIETDVQLTADGVVVIFHDDLLDRLTELIGPVSARTWPELATAKVCGQGTIPRLEDALTAWPDVRFNIDAKTDEVAGPLCRLAKGDNLDRICLAAESEARINFIRGEVGEGLCTAASTGEAARFLLPALAGLKPRPPLADCFQVPPSARGLPLLTPRQLARVREAGKALHVWTIDDPGHMARLLERGVDGIMTDRPAALKEVLKARKLGF